MTPAVEPVTRFVVHPGVYKDSLVLMQLQQRLLDRPGVVEAGAAMASAANLELLAAGGLLPGTLPALQAEDLLVVVRADSEEEAEAALAALGELLERRHAAEASAYRPRSIDGALSLLPDARWALVSVPGQYADRVARDALDRNLNVFLYSDNVASDAARELKRAAALRGLMVLGPDCGTAIVGGVGLGFANHVRRGAIGLVGGSGTGLQAVSVRIHALGAGVSQAIGTGGQDLSEAIGGITTRQALRVLADDAGTRVIVLVSKAPDETVARQALDQVAACGKPAVVYFQGFDPAAGATSGNVHLVGSLEEAATKAVSLLGADEPAEATSAPTGPSVTPAVGLLRGLFAGGTLAAETLHAICDRVASLHSNLPGRKWRQLDDLFVSRGNTVLDLGADELTRGRLHPMIDQSERLKRLAVEAADPQVGLLLLDVVLGEGAHADPASELAPAVRAALEAAVAGNRELRIVVVLVGTEDDPQEIDAQRERLETAGAVVVESVDHAVRHVPLDRVEEDPTKPMLPKNRDPLDRVAPGSLPPLMGDAPIPASAFAAPLAAVNIGLESFHASLVAQGAEAVQVDWRPPAGGDDRLLGILDRLRGARAEAQEVT